MPKLVVPPGIKSQLQSRLGDLKNTKGYLVHFLIVIPAKGAEARVVLGTKSQATTISALKKAWPGDKGLAGNPQTWVVARGVLEGRDGKAYNHPSTVGHSPKDVSLTKLLKAAKSTLAKLSGASQLDKHFAAPVLTPKDPTTLKGEDDPTEVVGDDDVVPTKPKTSVGDDLEPPRRRLRERRNSVPDLRRQIDEVAEHRVGDAVVDEDARGRVDEARDLLEALRNVVESSSTRVRTQRDRIVLIQKQVGDRELPASLNELRDDMLEVEEDVVGLDQVANDQLTLAETCVSNAADAVSRGGGADLAKALAGRYRAALVASNAHVDGARRLTGAIESFLKSLSLWLNLKARVVGLDEAKLAHLVERIPAAEALLRTPLGLPSDEEETGRAILRQLLTQSKLPVRKVQTAITAVSSKASAGSEEDRKKRFNALVTTLRKGDLYSTQDLQSVAAACRGLVDDVFRVYEDSAGFAGSLPPDLEQKYREAARVAAVGEGWMSGSVLRDRSGKAIPLSPRVSMGVAVIGAGPVGLLAAIEAMLAGARRVTIFEARSLAYSRYNVLKLLPATIQRFKRAGVWERLTKPEGQDYGSNPSAFPTRNIELALAERAIELGISIQTGLRFAGAEPVKGGPGVALSFVDRDEPVLADAVIVSVGGSVTSAARGGVSLAQKLEFEVETSKAVDYAATTFLTGKSREGEAPKRAHPPGWKYTFTPPDMTYVVSQLTEEEADFFSKNPQEFERFVQRVVLEEGKSGLFTPKLGDPEARASHFQISLKRALRPGDAQSKVVLAGDAAGTPHPSTALGLNTGAKEVGSVGDLVQSLVDPSLSEEDRQVAVESYSFEVGRMTRHMMVMGLDSMLGTAAKQATSAIFQIGSALSRAGFEQGVRDAWTTPLSHRIRAEDRPKLEDEDYKTAAEDWILATRALTKDLRDLLRAWGNDDVDNEARRLGLRRVFLANEIEPPNLPPMRPPPEPPQDDL